MARAIYRVLRGVKDLPPRRILVKKISANPTVLDLVALHNSIAFDVLVRNRDTVSANVTLGDNLEYVLNSNESISHSDVQESLIQVSGITSGEIIIHFLDIALLKRLEAVEVE